MNSVLAENGDEVKVKAAKAVAEPEFVELTVVIPMGELPSDDPELDLEEPLGEALEEAEAGEVTGSGTMPDNTFDIDVTTERSQKKKALRVIRKVLGKLKCPVSTVIVEDAEPPVRHPLYEVPPSGKEPSRKKER